MVREKSPVVVSLPHCSEGGSSCEWARGHHGAGLDLEKAPSDVFPQFGQDTDQRVPVGEERVDIVQIFCRIFSFYTIQTCQEG